jgi:hypothetical protein
MESPSLNDLRRQGVDVEISCSSCHGVTHATANGLVRQFGGDLTLDQFRQRVLCPICGRDAGVTVRQAPADFPTEPGRDRRRLVR